MCEKDDSLAVLSSPNPLKTSMYFDKQRNSFQLLYCLKMISSYKQLATSNHYSLVSGKL